MSDAEEWASAAWRDAAVAWAAEALAARGRRVTGEVQQPHLRPWSTVLRIPTDDGPVWLKANGPGTAYEPALLAALGAWRRHDVLVPLAVDIGRGWSLQPDGGPTLRSVQADAPDAAAWTRILQQYAVLQRALEPRVDDLLAIGVPDVRPSAVPRLFDALIDDDEAMLRGRPGGLADEQDRHVRAARADLVAWCAELDAGGVAPTLQHDDLHDANVLIGDGYRFFDWGDAAIAHPFGSLLVCLRSVAHRADPGRVALARLRDAYLDGWTDLLDLPALRRQATLAMRVACIGRALAWRRALDGAPTPGRAEWREAVPGWLLELFEAQPGQA